MWINFVLARVECYIADSNNTTPSSLGISMSIKSPKLTLLLSLFLMVGIAALVAVAQRGGQRRGGRGGGRDQALLNAPYVGIVTSKGKQEGLFKIAQTGVSTDEVREAAEAFLDSLTEAQIQKTMFPIDSSEWRKWDNRHFPVRQGVGFNEMTEAQREAAFGMMSKSLSAKGLKKTKDIMKLNGTLAELCNDFDQYGEWLYWITIMGSPSKDKPWGWQLDGHHVIVNYFVLGEQVVMSPVFMGSEPVEALDGKFKGTIVMQDEQDKGLEFMLSLTEAQQDAATLMKDKPANNNLSEAYKDNIELDFAGLKCDKLSDAQTSKLMALVEEYVGNMRKPHAQVRMKEVKKHLADTYFAWIGGATDKSVYYYRVHSPVVLIEFDHQRRVAPFRSNAPTREHIHTVVRTPNGNDYGKDLLRQHYEQHSHPH